MPEPVSLTIGALVAALVTKAAEKTGESAAEGGAGLLARLSSRVRERLSRDKEASTALAQLEEAPDDSARAQALARVVDQRSADDPDLTDELRAIVDEARAAGVYTGSMSAWGDQNVQAAGIVNSSINVNYRGSDGGHHGEG